MSTTVDASGKGADMTRNGRPASMADVAKLVGVSHQTVSRVVNDKGRVSPRTRERVQAAIEQLGYRPNSVARALVTARSGIIVIAPIDSLARLRPPRGRRCRSLRCRVDARLGVECRLCTRISAAVRAFSRSTSSRLGTKTSCVSRVPRSGSRRVNEWPGGVRQWARVPCGCASLLWGHGRHAGATPLDRDFLSRCSPMR